MTSIKKIQESIDEVYSIHERAEEMNEQLSEKIDDLIVHQESFMSSTKQLTTQLTELMTEHFKRVISQANEATETYGDVVNRLEHFIDHVHEQKYEKLEKLRQIRKKVIITLASLACLALILGGLNVYLSKKAFLKYSKIQEMPTLLDYKGKRYVKIKPSSETRFNDGKDKPIGWFAEVG